MEWDQEHACVHGGFIAARRENADRESDTFVSFPFDLPAASVFPRIYSAPQGFGVSLSVHPPD